MEYVPPLGGPYVGASSGTFNTDDEKNVIGLFFDILVNNNNGKQQQQQKSKKKDSKILDDDESSTTNLSSRSSSSSSSGTLQRISSIKMSVRLKQIANGEEGIT